MQPPCSLASPIARRAYAAAISGAPFTIEMLTIAAVCALLIGPTEKAAAVEADGSVGARKLFLGSPQPPMGTTSSTTKQCEDHSAAGARQDCLGTGGGWRRFRSRRYPRRTA